MIILQLLSSMPPGSLLAIQASYGSFRVPPEAPPGTHLYRRLASGRIGIANWPWIAGKWNIYWALTLFYLMDIKYGSLRVDTVKFFEMRGHIEGYC
jgi:hypothetical protein